LLEANKAVPYIQLLDLCSHCYFYFYRFKVSSAFAAIKVILPEKVLSGYTLATTLVVLLLILQLDFHFTFTFNFNFDTFTMSNNCVAGIPVMIDPTSILLINPLMVL
jgi:hypothetical protein